MPLASVIIPAYNRRDVVMEAVNSVLSQTLLDCEVIVVDDGSTDDTRDVVEAMADARVRCYGKENGGAASARNLGLAKASGKYVAFLDSDDYWPEDYLETVIGQLERNPEFGAAYTPVTVVYPDGTKKKSHKAPEGRSGRLTVELFLKGFVWPSASVFRRSVWEDFFFDENIRRSYEDGDAFLRLSMKTLYLFVPEVEAFYRISEDSISSEVGVACTRILVLERFYYRLGGRDVVPAITARKRLSHACRKVAKDRLGKRLRTSSLKLYGRALRYWPFDPRLYVEAGRALMLSKAGDKAPDWAMPGPFGAPLGTHRFK